MKNKLYIFVLFMPALAFCQHTNSLTVSFSGLQGKQGKVYVALYDSEESFLNKEFKTSIVSIEDGKAKAFFEGIPNGFYAVSSFYDKNGNGKLDTNFMGIPKEPYQFSNNSKGTFGPPKFEQAKFNITTDQIVYLNFN